MDRLTKRAEFLAVARGVRSARRGFVLQAAKPASSMVVDPADAAIVPRCGFTVTKKVGNAVVRNRIRRRFREAVRLSAAGLAEYGTDYVLVGRREALSLEFRALTAELAGAFRQVNLRLAGSAPAGSGKDPDGNGKRDTRTSDGKRSDNPRPAQAGRSSTGRTS